MRYRIERYDYNGFSTSYGGGFSEQEMKEIIKGYTYDTDLSNEHFSYYTRKNGTKMFVVTKE